MRAQKMSLWHSPAPVKCLRLHSWVASGVLSIMATPYWVGPINHAAWRTQKGTRPNPLLAAGQRRLTAGDLALTLCTRATRCAAPFMANAAEICNRALNIALSHRDYCWMWDARQGEWCCVCLRCGMRRAVRAAGFSALAFRPSCVLMMGGGLFAPRAVVHSSAQLSSVQFAIDWNQIFYWFCHSLILARAENIHQE